MEIVPSECDVPALRAPIAPSGRTFTIGLQRARFNKEVGDVVEVNAPGGVKTYEILKVEWL